MSFALSSVFSSASCTRGPPLPRTTTTPPYFARIGTRQGWTPFDRRNSPSCVSNLTTRSATTLQRSPIAAYARGCGIGVTCPAQFRRSRPMAELRNAQRVSYKATYNQISPTATVHEPPSSSRRPVPRRAFDKAAFVQSLRIVAEELPVLKKATSRNASRAAAYAAVEQLVNDRTASSTLNNAAAFAHVDPSALMEIALQLAAYRQTVGDEVKQSVAGILSAYRGSFAAAAASDA